MDIPHAFSLGLGLYPAEKSQKYLDWTVATPRNPYQTRLQIEKGKKKKIDV
jgi:hypothetical protein